MSTATKNNNKEKFDLDPFQKEAIEAIKSGVSVITCAPTGAGKTVIAREAIRMAIDEGKKVFYTAPLKALINQKYTEFCQEFGEDKVGIITGDTNKNRDSQVIVMTTEIYRNMLYGTTFGSIDPFLADLKYLIFDEFHYINDSSRGTVWEESVIYSPKSVQLVALSATINNPKDLVNWIKDIHGDCALVETDHRPVPLMHYYFKEESLSPLLTPNGKLNPKLKERNDNRFGKRNGKFGNRFSGGQGAKSSIPKVVEELHKKQMLPAIYFVFSRKGCDKAAKECENLNLLNKEEASKLNKCIDEAIAFSPILEKFNHLDLLRKGIAAHHAGMLPQVKTLIEELFTQALIKVVFSTETLAAGINMPAKATVINNLSKATDEGFRTLKASEFLQMSGRAGRRGMDEAGYVVTVKNGNYSAGEVAFLASSKAEDVTSHFTASYEMVLNLLQSHKYDEVKALVEKSFGQYLVKHTLKEDVIEKKKLEGQIMELQHPLCPGEMGDLNYYREMQTKLDETRRQKKQYEKEMNPMVDDLEASLEILTMEAKGYPCNGCPKQKPCSKQMDKIKRYKSQVKKLDQRVNEIKNMTWENFERVVDLLKDEKYLDKDYNPTELGKTCASFRTDNSFFMTELVNHPMFKGLDAIQFAGLLSCFVIGEARNRDKSFADVSRTAISLERDYKGLARRVIQKQRNFGINKSVELNPNISAVIEEWANGSTWEDLIEKTFLDDGDILRCIRRTVDVSKQISKAPNVKPEVQKLADEAVRKLERDIVVETV